MSSASDARGGFMFCTDCGTSNEAAPNFCHACGVRLVTPSATPPPQPLPASVVSNAVAPSLPTTIEYATVGKRTLAMVIDALILNGVSFVVGFVVALCGELMVDSFNYADLKGFLWLVGAAGGWLYYAGMESSSHQATVGKHIVKIRVVDVNGERISFGRATGRFVGRFLSVISLGIGFIMAAFTKRGQTLHDLMAGCVVIRNAAAPAGSVPVRDGQQQQPMRSLSPAATAIIAAAAVLGVSVLARSTASPASKDSASPRSSNSSPQSSDDDYKRWLNELRPAAAASARASRIDGPETASPRILMCYDNTEGRSQVDPWVLRIDEAKSRAAMVVHVANESIRRGVPPGNRIGSLDVSERAYSVLIPADSGQLGTPSAWGRMQFAFEIDRFTGLGKLEIGEEKYGETLKFPLRCLAGQASPRL
jgi:uncharacterized RDD family membrane protein YckC